MKIFILLTFFLLFAFYKTSISQITEEEFNDHLYNVQTELAQIDSRLIDYINNNIYKYSLLESLSNDLTAINTDVKECKQFIGDNIQDLQYQQTIDNFNDIIPLLNESIDNYNIYASNYNKIISVSETTEDKKIKKKIKAVSDLLNGLDELFNGK